MFGERLNEARHARGDTEQSGDQPAHASLLQERPNGAAAADARQDCGYLKVMTDLPLCSIEKEGDGN